MKKPFFSSVLGYSSAVLTIAGLTFYCIARIAYSIYYGHYGVSPEAVGVTFQSLLIQEAAPVNVVLLATVTAILLRSGWLINSADLDELETRHRIDTAVSEQDLLIRSIGSGVVSDRDAELRNLERVKGRLANLESERSAAAEGSRLIKHRGMRWLAAGLLIFALWGTGMITEALVTPTGPRASQWFDPLQVDVVSVTSLRLLETPYDNIGKDVQIKSPLFLGASDMNYVLYDQDGGTIWLIPERLATLSLR
jgi:hypothetical protein